MKEKTDIERGIFALEKKAKLIKKVQTVINTILANACYSDCMMEKQIERGQNKGNLDDKEKELLKRGWAYRNKLALELAEETGAFLNEHA